MDDQLKELIENYKIPKNAVELVSQTKIVFLVGVSGAGKDTILRELIKTGHYKLIISHTTRQPRENAGVIEQDGQDYHFINLSIAKRMLQEHEFVEAKHYSGNIYGTSIDEIQKAVNEGKIPISDIEVQGVSEYMSIGSSVIPIFLLPPSFEIWQNRLLSRYAGREPDSEDLKARMRTAKKELQEALNKEYFEFVINDELDRTVSAVDEITHGSLSTNKNIQAKATAMLLLQKLDKFS